VSYRVPSLRAQFDLVDLLTVPGRKLTPTDVRRMFVSAAFFGDPRVVLLDNPTLDMDLPARQRFWATMQVRPC
jgi:ABC-2 type transport system ATP-binding protein